MYIIDLQNEKREESFLIDILVNEHKNIKVILSSVEHISREIANGGEVDVELYRRIIDFIRNYADKYHHRKEEKYLFNEMAKDSNAEGPVQGMLLEHDMGRKYITHLELALNDYEKGNKDAKVRIIAYGIAYKDLLADHIFKEDNVIYRFALRVIPEDVAKGLEKEFVNIENDEDNKAIREKYVSLVNELKDRFNISE